MSNGNIPKPVQTLSLEEFERMQQPSRPQENLRPEPQARPAELGIRKPVKNVPVEEFMQEAPAQPSVRDVARAEVAKAVNGDEYPSKGAPDERASWLDRVMGVPRFRQQEDEQTPAPGNPRFFDRLEKAVPERMKMMAAGLKRMRAENNAETHRGMMEGFSDENQRRMGYKPEEADAQLEKKVAEAEREYKTAQHRLEKELADLEPGGVEYYAHHILGASVEMVPAVIASMVTRNPSVGATLIGGQVFSDKYGDARASGRSREEALQDASFYAATEMITERIPLGIITKEGGKAFTRIWKGAVAEGIQEPITEALQIAYEAGILNDPQWYDEDGNFKVADAVHALKDAMIIGTGAGGSLSVGVSGVDAARQKWRERKQEKEFEQEMGQAASELRDEDHRAPQDPAPKALDDRSGDITVDSRGTAATHEQRADFEASQEQQPAQPLGLPAPRMVADERGHVAPESRFRAELEEMGFTPDVQQAAARQTERDAEMVVESPTEPEAPPAEKARQEAVAQQQNWVEQKPWKRPNTPRSTRRVQPEHDTVLEALSKMVNPNGQRGLSAEEAEAQGIDPAAFKSAGHGIKRTFTKNGMSFDEAAEKLAELGYPVMNEQGQYDPNVLLDLIDRELAGTPVRALSADEATFEKLYESRMAALEADDRPTPKRLAREAEILAWHDELDGSEQGWDVDTSDLPPRFFGEEEYDADMEPAARTLADLAEIASRHDADAAEAALEHPDAGESRARLIKIIREGNDNAGQDANQADAAGAGEAVPAEEGLSGEEESTSEEDRLLAGYDASDLDAKAARERDADKPRAEQPSLETGDPSDLFSQARNQTDLVSQPPDRRRTAPEVRAEYSPEDIERLRAENESLRQKAYTEPMTGLKNRAAWEEREPKPAVALVDVDGLKWINDNLGYDSGDQLLKAIGEALGQHSELAYRIGGDEFAIEGDSAEDVKRVMDAVNAFLAGAKIDFQTPDGQIVTYTGLDISYGIGGNSNEAESQLKESRAERAARGEYQRGQQPRGIRVDTAEGQQDQEDSPAEEEVTSDGPDLSPAAVREKRRTDKAFKAAYDSRDGADAPHPESHVAAEFLKGWLDAEAGRPLDTSQGNRPTPEMRLTGFNPVHPYRSGYESQRAGEPRRIPTLTVDTAADDAATSPANERPAPTAAQIEAGNYKKGHVTLHGMDVTIENPRGTHRRPEWPPLAHHYGYLKGTEGNDGEHIDVFVGPDAENADLPVFVIDQPKPNGHFDEHKVMLGFADEQAAREGYLANYTDGWKLGPVTEMSLPKFKEWLQTADLTKRASEATEAASDNPDEEITAYGDESLDLRRTQDKLASLDTERSDDDYRNLPLSKLWPKKEIDAIEDHDLAALAYAARAEIPAKPRKPWAVNRWAEQVKMLTGLTKAFRDNRETAEAMLREDRRGLEQFVNKVDLLRGLDRKHWPRIGAVAIHPDAYRYAEDGNTKIPSPHASLMIDGRRERFDATKTAADLIEPVRDLLEAKPTDAGGKAMGFTVRGRADYAYIHKEGDAERRRLKEFHGEDATKQALAYKRDNAADLTAAWEMVKARDNVKKSDMRGKENRGRIGADHRNGRNVTVEEFHSTFGLRHVDWGKWVADGPERQQFLNEAFDAFMDLAGITGLPPKAIGLNGNLIVTFGKRGSGWGAAHFEAGQQIINLTRTKGAGSLAHEWFHAVDNYFQRQRGAADGTGREKVFITYNPESYYEHPRGDRLPAREFEAAIAAQKQGKRGRYFVRNPEQWKKIDGVRPEVGVRFAELVEALNKSPMAKRAKRIDKGKGDGYWSRIIERAARAFENHVIYKLAQNGQHNDFLANVTRVEDFKRDPDRYPYLLDSEMEPVVAAFDQLFETIETREDDSGRVAMFDQGEAPPSTGIPVVEAKAHVASLIKGWKGRFTIEVVESADGLPEHLKKSAGDAQNRVRGAIDTGANHIYLVAGNLESVEQLERTLFHEALGHFGIRAMFGPQLDAFLGQVYQAYGRRRFREIADRYGLDLSKREDQLVAAEEMVAQIAEDVNQGTATQRAQKWWDRFIEAVRKALRKIGFKLDFTAAEIRNAVRGAGEAVREGRAENPNAAAANVFRFDVGAPAFVDGFTTPSDTLVDRIRQKLQDKYIDLRRVQESVKTSGKKIIDDANAYLAEELFHGRTEFRIEDSRENLTVKPMLDAIKAAGMTVEQADEFLYARHAKERNARISEINPAFEEGSGSGMTDAEADAILSKYKGNAKAQRIGQIADAIVADQRRILVEEGLETAESVEQWANTYQHYVPLKGGEGVDDGRIQPGRGRGFDVRGKQKRAFGRRSRADAIVANLIAQYETTIVRAEKAKVGRALLSFVNENPNPDLWEVDKPAFAPRINPGTGLVMYGPDPTYKLADNVLAVKVAGVDHHITLRGDRGKRIAGAMKNLGAADVGSFIRGLAVVNRYLSFVNTALNPEFVISNLARDLQTAGINLAGTEAKDRTGQILRDTGKAWHGIRSVLKGKDGGAWSEAFKEFERLGGKTGWVDAHSDVDRAQRALGNELKAAARGNLHPLKIAKKIKDVVTEENTAVENAVRLAAFVHAKEMGLSPRQAASLAKNLTVNFNRKGELGVVMNSLYLFYNASVQGSVRVMQALKNREVQKIVGGVVLVALITDIMNRILGGDDESGKPNYDAIPSYVKERNFIIMKADGSGDYYKIPLPYGYNVFHALGREIGFGVSQAAGMTDEFKAGEATLRVVDAVVGSFNPLGSDSTLLQFVSPTIADPLVQVSENKDFAGRKVSPDQSPFDVSPAPDSTKYWSSTSEPAKAVAKKLNELTGGNEVRPGAIDVSPAVLDHMAEFIGGGAGRFALNTVDTTAKFAQGEPIDNYRIPFVRKVTGEVGTREATGEYMENLQQVEYAAEEMKAAAKNNDREWRDRVRKEQGHYLRARTMVQTAEKQLRGLRQQRRGIQESELSWAKKRERLERIEEKMETIMVRVNGKIREAKKVD